MEPWRALEEDFSRPFFFEFAFTSSWGWSTASCPAFVTSSFLATKFWSIDDVEEELVVEEVEVEVDELVLVLLEGVVLEEEDELVEEEVLEEVDDGKDVVQLLAEIEDEEEGRELELDVVGVVVQPANKNKLF